jgi:UDP-glucuronate 4-epimerase
MSDETILVTGAAGFIGFHVTQKLLQAGRRVIGLDNINSYYDPKLKEARLDVLKNDPAFSFVKLDLADRTGVADLFRAHLQGFTNILEGCRHNACRHLLYASSSSVYGANTKLPFSVHDSVDHPISLYAASKKANELMAHAYSHLYRIPSTGLRFFTVYGPWGRPDMAMFLFAKAILEGQPIKLFNHGNMQRDFTYVDDVTEAIVRLIDHAPVGQAKTPDTAPDPGTSAAPWRVFNVGNNHPEELLKVVELLEKEFGRTAVKELLPMQPGDVPATYADVDDLMREVGFRPSTTIEDGIARFSAWFRDYHRL